MGGALWVIVEKPDYLDETIHLPTSCRRCLCSPYWIPVAPPPGGMARPWMFAWRMVDCTELRVVDDPQVVVNGHRRGQGDNRILDDVLFNSGTRRLAPASSMDCDESSEHLR